ncbi:tRNA pseudouridine(65) synthase TruC [Fulvitalea axinellae]|uniref:tRNA pseudouridine synthase C n=1 Tax=Fulvitalea axinellae TaxID=1182444 RepID=A0AAU9D9S6_9BACT|nr:tRNA pseudouridine(65) synthase TruC [Fulvitalea axinellae]
MLEILYKDNDIVAINKPNNLLVHRTPLARGEKQFAMQMLRDQLGQHVYPIHRIDRPTSGVLLFGLNKRITAEIQNLFEEHLTIKKYWLIARGHTPENDEINIPINSEYDETLRDAQTIFKTIARTEIPFQTSKFPTSRYSLVEAQPLTGRTHQIRQHFAKIRHYILGDRRYGDCKQNKLFDEHPGKGLLLHSRSLSFTHPTTKKEVTITAPLRDHFKRSLKFIGLSEYSHENTAEG